jgi:hypothetical protein
VSGDEFAERALIQVLRFGATMLVPAAAVGLSQRGERFAIALDGGDELVARSVLVASMQSRRSDHAVGDAGYQHLGRVLAGSDPDGALGTSPAEEIPAPVLVRRCPRGVHDDVHVRGCTDLLVKDGHPAVAVAYVLATVIAGVSLAWVGIVAGRALSAGRVARLGLAIVVGLSGALGAVARYLIDGVFMPPDLGRHRRGHGPLIYSCGTGRSGQLRLALARRFPLGPRWPRVSTELPVDPGSQAFIVEDPHVAAEDLVVTSPQMARACCSTSRRLDPVKERRKAGSVFPLDVADLPIADPDSDGVGVVLVGRLTDEGGGEVPAGSGPIGTGDDAVQLSGVEGQPGDAPVTAQGQSQRGQGSRSHPGPRWVAAGNRHGRPYRREERGTALQVLDPFNAAS